MDITEAQNSVTLEIKLFTEHCKTYVYITYKNSVSNLRLSYHKMISFTEQDGFKPSRTHTHIYIYIHTHKHTHTHTHTFPCRTTAERKVPVTLPNR